MNRKPDARSQLNRLSKNRQAAVADYAARHTLPETIEWLKSPVSPPGPRAASPPPAPRNRADCGFLLSGFLLFPRPPESRRLRRGTG